MITSQDADVVIAGAGPTGLLLAAELALAGVRVVVLERREEADPTIKAGSINVATAEILDRRGLRPAARAAQRRTMDAMAAFAAGPAGRSASRSWQEQRGPAGDGDEAPAFPVTGHFAGIFFRPGLVDQTDPDIVAHRGAAGSTLVTQADVEAILGEHAVSLGAVVRRGVEVTGLRGLAGAESGAESGDEPGADAGIELETSAGPLRAAWVVGADGGRSVIRKLAGIGFPGTDPEITGYQAIADLDGAEQWRPGWTWTPTGVYSYGPVPGRILTVQFTGAPADRSAPVTAAELQASIRLVSGTDVRVTALHGTATRWTDNARQAESYRAGRVLLAGDAAHVHSPFSGQGLNLGAGDAINLGWKLAATVQGWAPPGLLDTYDVERRPVGAWVLDWTRAQVALMRGDAKTAELRKVVAGDLLGNSASMTRVVRETAGIAQAYDVAEAGQPAGTEPARTEPARTEPAGTEPARTEPARTGAAGAEPDDRSHPLTGRLIGDTPLAGGGRLADHAHAGRFVLLDRTEPGLLAHAAAAWSDRIAVVPEAEAAPDGPAQYRSLTGLLVRPDGVIAWAADDASPDTEGLVAALRRWAGAPG